MRFPDFGKVETRDDLERLFFYLLDDNDAQEWKNDDVYSFLQAMVAWLHDANQDSLSWQLFADMLNSAASGDPHR